MLAVVVDNGELHNLHYVQQNDLLAENTVSISWIGTVGPTTIYGLKDNDTRNVDNKDVSHKDRFTSYERKSKGINEVVFSF
jgi:hypothetical protein